MRALILCAGEGTRLKPLTEKLAKPAVPLMNLPLWAYPLQLIESLKPSEVHVNLHTLPETVRRSFSQHASLGCPLFFHEEKELLGSAGPLLHLKNSFKDDHQEVLLANGDGVILSKNPHVLKQLQERHRQSKALATVLAMPMEGAGKDFSAVWTNRGQKLLGIGTQAPTAEATPFHYASIILFSSHIYDYVRETSRNIFTDVLLPACEKKELVQVFTSSDLLFFEVGNLKGLKDAHLKMCEIVQTHQTQWNLVDVFDRFQPGWRNYQKDNVFRYSPIKELMIDNTSKHLTLVAKSFKPSNETQICIKGPSCLYGTAQTLPYEINGIYWSHINCALTNEGEFIQF